MITSVSRPWRCFVLAVALLLLPASAWCADIKLDIRPGPGVTEQRKLSDYFPPLKDTNLDTDVFFLDSGKPGATGLIIGGTHGNEIAGSVAALVALENAVITEGRLIVIPYTNRSAQSMPDSRNGIDQRLMVHSRGGERYLTYGDRRTDPLDQHSEDPDMYENPGGFVLKNGQEARNLNRTYPGKAVGTGTEQLAYAIIEMVKKERVDFSLDMHEANTPETDKQDDGDYTPGGNKRLSYTLVAHPRGLEMAAYALLAMEEDTGISMKLEESNQSYRGLSHLEIGDATDCLSFLSESPNPGQDRGRADADVINDAMYPLTHRVGMHLRLFKHLADAYADYHDKVLEMKDLPEYRDLLAGDIGRYLN
ncbi:MAG: hypothetical protein WBS20_06935 [Lysobacterales bacterium]